MSEGKTERRPPSAGCLLKAQQIQSETFIRQPKTQHPREGARRSEDRTLARSHAIESTYRGVAQPGSASALGAEGRGFKSLRPDQFLKPHRIPEKTLF